MFGDNFIRLSYEGSPGLKVVAAAPPPDFYATVHPDSYATVHMDSKKKLLCVRDASAIDGNRRQINQASIHFELVER